MGVSVHIKKRLDNFLLDISFESEAKRIGILGASGCGKSMTLKSIAGIAVPDEGKIEAGGRTFFDSSARIAMQDICFRIMPCSLL